MKGVRKEEWRRRVLDGIGERKGERKSCVLKVKRREEGGKRGGRVLEVEVGWMEGEREPR